MNYNITTVQLYYDCVHLYLVNACYGTLCRFVLLHRSINQKAIFKTETKVGKPKFIFYTEHEISFLCNSHFFSYSPSNITGNFNFVISLLTTLSRYNGKQKAGGCDRDQ